MTTKIPKNYLQKTYTPDNLRSIITRLLSRSDISEVSIKQYTTKIVEWLGYIKTPKILYNLIIDPEESLKVLESMPIKHTPQNHHIFISAVVAFIKNVLTQAPYRLEDTFKKWKEIQKKNWAPIQEHYDNNEPSAKQANMIMPYEELVRRMYELPVGSDARLLLAFYTLIPPVRADYFATEILKDATEQPTEDNYIILSEKKLVLQNFKTARKYEKIETIMPKALMDELTESLRLEPRKYLFTTEKKKLAFSREAFSQWANRQLSDVFHKQMNLTVLRHIYITSKINAKTPPMEMRKIAQQMGHSRALQRVYEWAQ